MTLQTDIETMVATALDFLPTILDDILALGILPFWASMPLRLVNRALRKVIGNPQLRNKIIKKVGARACPPARQL